MAEQSNLQKLQQLLQQQGIIIHKDVTEQSATMVISFNELHDVAEIIKNYRKMLQKLNLPIKYSNQSQDQANAPYNRQIQEQREQEFFADGSSSSTDHSNENKNKDIKSQMHVHSPANQADPEVDFNSLAQKIKDVLQSDSNIQPQPKKIIQTTYIPLISALQAQMSKLLQELEIVQQKLKEAQQDDPYQQLKRLQDQETNLQEKIYQSLQKFRTLYQSLDSNQKKLKLGKRLLSSKLFFGKQKNLVKIVDYHVLLACKGLYDIKEQPEEDSD